MLHVTIRFYEELNDFLPVSQRKTDIELPCPEPRSIKDLIESLGVPHTEVDLILADGESVGFEHPVSPGERYSIYPVFETFDIAKVSRLRRPPLREPKFVADVHLGKLVRHLRLLGFDCLYDRRWDDEELALVSADRGRVLLTRDRGLLKRSIVIHGIYIRSDRAGEQLRQVVNRLQLGSKISPFTRCVRCNGRLKSVAKETVRGDVPAYTFANHEAFARCDKCSRVYWRGTHSRRLNQIIALAKRRQGGKSV